MKSIEVHLYGKLRRYTANIDPRMPSTVTVEVEDGTTILELLEKIGVPVDEVGSNIFLNYQYSSVSREIHESGRLAVFPDDMNLLYKWHFSKKR